MDHVTTALDVPERTACRVLGQHRSTQRKARRTTDDEAALTQAVVALAKQYGRYGYRRITALLRAEGWASTTSALNGSGAVRGCACLLGSRSAGGCG